MSDTGNTSPHRSTSPATSTESVEKAREAWHEPDGQPEASTSRSTSPKPGEEQPDANNDAKSVASPGAPSPAWQAIWSPQHNAYYFFNTVTQETTWANPLQAEQQAAMQATPADLALPPASESSENNGPMYSESSTPSYTALQTAAAAQGIDPSLAHLDPSLAGPSNSPAAFSYTAKFNARTGAFTRPDGRDPTHLSEFERAKRMSEFYFDVGAWEKEVEERKRKGDGEGEGGNERKKNKPTKKDLERFKEQKRLKKIAKTAWLRT